MPWKSQSIFFNPLNMQFIFLNLHLHPQVPEQKPGTQAFLTWLPQLDSTGPNSSEMGCKNGIRICIKYVHSSGDKGYRTTKPPRVTCLEPPRDGGGGQFALSTQTSPYKVWFNSPRDQLALPNANGSLPLGREINYAARPRRRQSVLVRAVAWDTEADHKRHPKRH